MSSVIPNTALGKLGDGSIDWNSDDIDVMLLTNSYVPDIDADEFIDDISANEVSNSGSYTAGGIDATCSVTIDDANDRAIYDANNLQVTGFTGTFRYAVWYKNTGTPGTSPIICVVDLTGDDIIVLSSTFDYTINAAGVFYLAQA